MHTLTVGQIEIHMLDDGTWRFPARYFFRNVPEAAWRRELDVDADGKIPVGHNYALVQTGGDRIVIDTGYGDDTHGGQTGHLLEELERSGCRRDQVTTVVNTHGHGDHIKRNTMVQDGERKPTFPRAHYLLGRADWDWFGGPGHVPEFDEHIALLARRGLLTLVDGELQLSREVRLLPTPGHTPGHITVLMESRGRTAIYLGDLCHLPVHFSHLDWVSTFDTDPDVTPHTRARVFQLAVERDALLLCPHAPSPGIGRLQRNHGGFLWQPAA